MNNSKFKKIIVLLSGIAFGLLIFSGIGYYKSSKKDNFTINDYTISTVHAESNPIESTFANTNNKHKKGAIVLCYHSFWGKPKFGTDFSLEQLEKQLDFLSKNGFKFITFNDLITNNINGNKNIFITIDDGNISAYDAYIKVFKKRNIKPLYAIYPCVIGRTNYAMKWENIKELSNEGCEIAAHGYFHQLLTDKLYKTNPELFNKEINLSKKVLEEKLNKKINVYVYPSGAYGPIAEEKIKEAGYLYAFTIDMGFLNTPIQNKYTIPRYMLTITNWEKFLDKFLIPEKLK